MNDEWKNLSGDEVRVRFAPSPTGDLHVGGVRTALFNYLFARHNNGKFLLRIEDTDIRRSTPEATQVILNGLKWLALTHDEDVVYQASRLERHKEAADKLLQSGAAYRAFETPQELADAREEANRQKQPYHYDRAGLKLSPDEIADRLERGISYAVRLKIPEGHVSFNDGVHGTITVACEEMDDFIILRSDGTPTYMLAVVVDDADMGITHIIRGDDHISNTPKQILIYRAMGLKEPLFDHVPMILGPDKKRLSKRHGATSVTSYRDAGFLPETIINYLGLLGWSPGDDRNEISLSELTEHFDISGIQSSGAVFDEKKLSWLNGLYISQTSYNDIADTLNIYAQSAVQSGKLDQIPSSDQIESAWNLLRNRIHKTDDLFDFGLFIFRDPVEYDKKGVRKHFKPEVMERLTIIARDFSDLDPFDTETIESVIRKRAEEWEISAGKLIHPLRLSTSGVTGGPSLFELLGTLGRDTVIRRINQAVEYINSLTL
ncbi:MAG: glutamate--tRNA ligase [Candidatus Electryoneaceae bacterium]|nr:glutamate--tRNA ligase [Candidatus Electryoneaceae bacterium]